MKFDVTPDDKSTVKTIIKIYEYRLSIKLIKKENNEFNIKAASVGQINKVIKGLNAKKTRGPNKIPVRIVKLGASVP